MDDEAHHGVTIAQHIARRYPADSNTLSNKPRVARPVTLRPIAARMSLTINLDGEARGRAEEIEHIVSRRMLAAKAQAFGVLAQLLPEEDFGKRHAPA